jgi:hypothetical protein
LTAPYLYEKSDRNTSISYKITKFPSEIFREILSIQAECPTFYVFCCF